MSVSEAIFERLPAPYFLGLCLIAVIVPLFAALASRPTFGGKSPAVLLENLPFIGSYRFFSARWDFMKEAAAHSSTGNYSFHLGKHPVVGLSSEAGRKTFFESAQLNFGAGYAVLFGTAPTLKEDESDERLNRGYDAWFARTFKHVLRKERLLQVVPTMISDARSRLEDLGPSGTTDPFDSIFKTIYLLTMRLVGCEEIAQSRANLEKSLDLFQAIEDSSTAASIIAPWAPVPAYFKRLLSGGRLYMMFQRFVDGRKATGTRHDDCLQELIDQDAAVPNILKFIIGAVFAAQLNMGINMAAQLCYLAVNDEWRKKCVDEVRSVAASFAPDPSAPLIEQLQYIPGDHWEMGFPIIDQCLKESIRMQLLGAAFRRNTSGKDIVIKNPNGTEEVIPNGAFATYHISNVHYDPDIYPDPTNWDPARFDEGRAEHKKGPHVYIGWGSGLHPCLGIRVARFEHSIVMAHFLAMFDWELTDVHGKPLQRVPDVDLNSWSATKPRVPVRLRYSMKEEARRATKA